MIMKCTDKGCGWEGTSKFCQECGKKMVEVNSFTEDTVVICNGKKDDGSLCQAELVPSMKFCGTCGTRIDSALFYTVKNICKQCGKALKPELVYCTECGGKCGQPVSSEELEQKPVQADEAGKDQSKRPDSHYELQGGEEPTAKNEKPVELQITHPAIQENHSESAKNTNAEQTEEVNSRVQNVSMPFGDNKSVPELATVGQTNVAGNEISIDECTVQKETQKIPENETGQFKRKSDDVDPENGTSHKLERLEVTKSQRDQRNQSEQDSQQDTSPINFQDVTISSFTQVAKPDKVEQESTKLPHNNAGNLNIIPIQKDKQIAGEIAVVHDVMATSTGNLNIVDESKKTGVQEVGESERVVETKQTGTHIDVTVQAVETPEESKSETLNTTNSSGNISLDKNLTGAKTGETSKTSIDVNQKKTENGDGKLRKVSKDGHGDQNIISNKTVHPDTMSQSGPVNTDTMTSTAKPPSDTNGQFVFGNARTLGLSQDGDNINVSTPFGKSLFTIENNNDAKSEYHTLLSKGAEHFSPLLRPDSRKKSQDDTVVYRNDLNDDKKNEQEKSELKPGVQTRSKTKEISDKDNKNKQGQSKNQSKTNDQSTSSQKKPNEKSLLVKFRVFTSEEFKFDPSSQTCVLAIGKDELGGWTNLSRKMTPKKTREALVYEMTYEEFIPTRLIAGGQSIPYKYIIVQNDTSKEHWEHYVRNKQSGVDINRELTVPFKVKGLESWQQYDSFLERKPKSLTEKFFDFFSWKKDLIKHAEKSISLLCPEMWEQAQLKPVEDVILQLRMLAECMRRCYFVDGKCWQDNQEYSKFMVVALTRGMIEASNIEELSSSELSDKRQQGTIGGLTILYIIKTMGIGFPDPKSVHILTKAMLIMVDNHKKECKDMLLAEKLFTGKKKDLLEAVLAFVKNISEQSKDPCWLSLMPWVHFLSNECAPFEKPKLDVTHDGEKAVWWGLASIRDEHKNFKRHTGKWAISFENMLKHVRNLFEIDYLLPRTFIATVDLHDLHGVLQTESIPMEVCLANLTFQLKEYKPTLWHNRDYGTNWLSSMSNEEKIVQDCIYLVLTQLQGTFFSPGCCPTQWKMAYIISTHLLKESMFAKRTETVYFSVQIVLHCVAMYDRVLAEQTPEEDRTKHEHFDTLRNILKETVKWLETYYYKWDVYLENILQVWNNVFAPVQMQSELVRNSWNKDLGEALVVNIQRKICVDNYLMKTFVQHYCQKVDGYNPCMQECMSKAAFLAIEKGHTLDYRSFTEAENKRFGELLSHLFLSEWKKNVGSADIDIKMFRHVLRWPPLPQYLKIYYKDGGKRINMLTEECVPYLVKAVSVIESKAKEVLTGTISIGDFNEITEKSARFPELAELVQTGKEINATFFTKAIEIRQKELAEFQIQSQQMATLASVCTQLENVDRRCIDDTLSKQEHIERHHINEFCNTGDVKQIADVATYQPSVCAFKVSPQVMDMVPQLHKCCESSTFMMLWNGQCRDVYNQCKILDDVVQKVWTPVKKRWDTVANNIRTGDIKFKHFEELLGQRYREGYDDMQAEMMAMNIQEKVIQTRIDQLRKYRKLETCVKGAKTILKFAQEFKLTGDFTQIKAIALHGETDPLMKSFDLNLMKACEFLKDLTPAKEKCLNMFVACEPLVRWLKQSMKGSGLKELKVFVDLASISAGDEPINIARVQCLHSAVTGYAPLIFDLEETCGYKELLQLCTIVWKELEANPQLPEKLKDTNRQLPWLKDVKKAHGSVEVTSLMQAEAINGNGIYTVGKNAWKKDAQKQTTNDSLQVVSDIVQLTVPEKEGRRQLRNYTFSQLQDLQSRLMLVAGKAEKGTASVDRFTMIFDSITRLSNVYLKLCNSGCVLFKDFTARFLCDPSPMRPVCIFLNFGQGDASPQLKGRRSHTEDLQEMIPELAKFLEMCLEEWLHHIKEKRKSYLHLNYFTVDQLVILQRELVKVGTEEGPTHLIYPLLSAVKEKCQPGDLLEAMTDAKKEIEREFEVEAKADDMDTEINVAADGLADVSLDVKRQNFIHELVEAGYEEALALRALEVVDPDDITQGIVWCMDHEDNAMSDDIDPTPLPAEVSKREKLSQGPVFTGWSQSTIDIQTLITTKITGLRQQEDVGSRPLIEELSSLWKLFLESISSNIRDYLSLEHLGLILKFLARKQIKEVSRSLPPGFKEGQPNLVICPSADVLMTTLSIYRMDKDQPLPQSDEVLMCTPNTTTDEVDIFWRRAIFDSEKKIHCLVNADMLDYDISETAERCLEEYLQDVNYQGLKYRLLVICGSDNQYRSGIVSSLDKFKRQQLPTNVNHLRDYVLNKLTIQQETVDGIKPAATVDREKSSVRVVKSWRAGVGKTLFKKRREGELARLNRGARQSETISIPLQEKSIDLHYVIGRLLEYTTQPDEAAARIFHIDISHEVQEGVDYLLFNLLVLGCLVDKTGFVWRKSTTDIYLIETMPLMMQAANRRIGDLQYVHAMLAVLPDLTCRSPQESLDIYQGHKPRDLKDFDQLFDDKQFRSTVFQRAFQYLFRLDQGKQLGDVSPHTVEGEPQTCLQTLLRHCGLQDPSWSELHHFVWFLNTQLVDFEQNSFVSAAAAEDLPGFTKFVLKFLITMSRDFSTRSLEMSEESPGLRVEQLHPGPREDDMEVEEGDGEDIDDLRAYQMRRTWESSPHPYLFFNSDRFTFTFLGFFIDRGTGNLIDSQSRNILERGIMAQNLYDSLVRNHAPIQENFDALARDQKIMKLCNVMGIEFPHDPDDTYELTTDNVKKIMAIYMRFRCDIPVIVMGETGCGKTRLVKFMCGLQVPPGVDMTNMILMKVHGGTTNRDIIRKVREAEAVARQNIEQYGRNVYTVLFFDEANTTESIGLIKEIMCDRSMEGRRLELCENLKMVAACNPYRKHSEKLIRKLEQAGLGYHVDADETTDRLGRVPMRRLVYRVQPLPQSLLPLVWDFGQLNTQVEDLYIRQMVRRYIREDKLPELPNLKETVSAILTASQEYMRAQMDECSFVSLRDVDRVLTVMSWFYQQSQEGRTLYDLMDKKIYGSGDDDKVNEDNFDEDEEEEEFFMENTPHRQHQIDDVTRSLILALGVCYHACLRTRPQYRAHVARYFSAPCQLTGGADQIGEEIECCQEVFLDHVHLEKNIARNMALKENVFMMVVCIELRVPLFLVGKPGSSKSLAKTIVSDAMQGNAAREVLFTELKQAQMVSFQCSPLSTPDGIVGTFRQCAQFQKDKDLDTFVSIVVLDEVGLAEDSPRMPLKTLHPLLEDGCQGDEKPEKYKKVAFIGISNWALDPAKMNRGILVQREVPDLDELKNSASGICRTDDALGNLIEPLIEPMAKSYLEIFVKATQSMREFYGLRDFYSLVKMVYSFVEKSKKQPTWYEMLHAIKRNFGGLDQVDPVEYFRKNLATVLHLDTERRLRDPDCSPSGLIEACLFDTENESRYLLLLTENYGALSIIQQQILSRSNDIRPITIFGSSFRSDQEYTQVCRNINKIKVCMETGNTVVLLNLENLYESLYDALNQYYVYFGGVRYVDLGLGTHRVKCPVHRNFRLIVVAEKQTVYKKFPIPLINRLEKHFLTINTMLTPEQQTMVKELEQWAIQFVTQKHKGFAMRKDSESMNIGDVFIGYHDDTCSAIILDVWKKYEDIEDKTRRNGLVFKEAKFVLLWCATPESLLRLENSDLSSQEQNFLNETYFFRQQHDSVIQYLNHFIGSQQTHQLQAQVTTHSKLLAGTHKTDLSKATGVSVDRILLLETLSSFDTEQQFTNRIQQHMQSTEKDPSLIVIQCDSGDVNANLIACARYCVRDEFEKMKETLRAPIHIVFIVQLPRVANYTGFQCGVWHSVHIDDLYTEDMNMPTLQDMQGKSVAGIFDNAVTEPSDMEVDQETEKKTSPFEEKMDWSNEINVEMRTGLLQLEDVVLDLETVEGVQKNRVNRHARLNVKGLILNCVQAALSMVKDKVENSKRETERVPLVLKLLHQENDAGGSSFLRGVCLLIAKLLKEKESKTHTASMAQHWLINEAASNENINKAGTFRRSCIQTLEGKVSPILAGIIAYLDTNENLSVLEDTRLPWKQELWLTLLNCTEALNLKLSDLLSPARHSELQEVFVMTTGCEGHMFGAKMPFSWLLISQISDILKQKSAIEIHEFEGDGTMKENRAESSARILREHPIGRVLSEIAREETIDEAVQEYIQDFVHTMYRAASEQEHQLVVQSIYYICTHVVENTNLLQALVHVHIAYDTLAPRLTYFRAMNSVWPECSSVIIDLKKKNPDHFMFKEQEFTFSALCLLIENVTPQKTELNNQQGRSKWLSNVHKYRPVVEKVISLHREDPRFYGEHTLHSVRRARCLWSRVMVVKLFLEHVCTTEKEDKITIKHCMPLWTILGEETNLKEITSLTGVEKFLKMCNKQAMKEYIGSEEKCGLCESPLEGPPITLPCEDVLCDQCYDGMISLGENTCAKCHQSFQEGWEPTRQPANKNAVDKLKDYQKRCNTFFMDIVSQLCFAENTAPSEEVVSKLLGYIFITTRARHHRTRDLTIFDTGIDPNPVFRSFLLQLLMRTSEESVLENLSHYLKQAEEFLTRGNENSSHYVELSLLVIQCLEDKFTQEASRADTGQVHYATQALNRARSGVDEEELNVQKLYGLASARMGLSIVAKYIADIVMRQMEARDVDHRVRKMIEAANVLCENTNIPWIRIFLVKFMCRCYGIDVYQAICRNPVPFLRWICVKDINREKVVEVSDRYIVCGDSYISLRESVTKVVLGEDTAHLEEKLQELQTAGVRVEPLLQLALHREVTASNLYPQQQRKNTARVVQVLDEFIDNCQIAKNKPLLKALVHNQLVPRHLVIREEEDLRHQGIQCLIVHFLTVMAHLQADRTLLQPLMSLMKMPQSMQNTFLPTMPQDDLEDVKEALLAARNQVRGADNNPVFYRCPNGHPYVIGDCGRPYVVAKCKCGADIGGQGHQLLATNRQDTGADTTLTGHILGCAQARGRGSQPERQLTPAYCSAVRMILHMSMYIGAGTNQLGIQNLIKPNITDAEVEDYVWLHIMRDLDDMHISLGLSVDDVMLLMHTVVDNIFRNHNEGEQLRADICQWSSKPGRREWEITFSAKFLQPVFQDLNRVLKTHNQNLAQDQRLGADPLLCLLYETDTNTEAENAAKIEQIPRVWRYRTPISLQHLRQEVQAQVRHNQHKVLQLFLQEEHNLRAMRYIPSILRLHRALFQRYQRKLDKAEASLITLAQLRKDEIAGEETDQLLNDFAEAWELVRRSLDLYLCPTEIGGTTVAKEYCTRKITDKTPVAMLLPTMKEAGLCSYALLDFLFRKQNDFLDKYIKESHRKPGSISTVQPREVTSAHLISYDPQQDIFPLILANCQYSFEMGKGTKIEYDFVGLERQLMDRFLFSKSRIDVGRVLQIDLMIYRTEFTNAEVFRKLADKITQEPLSTVVKTQISGEFRSLPDLCQSLDNLDITISFLKSTGGPPDRRLHEFMLETLQMDSSLHSQKAQQACEFRHAQSLWLLLSLQKSKKMTETRQHTESTFESVSAEMHDELLPELYAEFKEYALRKLSVEKLTQLVEVLHEFILLVVAVRQNPDDEDYTDTANNKLGEWFYGYIEGFDPPPLDIACLADFPKNILCKHSVHTWVCAYKFLKQKQTGNYTRY